MNLTDLKLLFASWKKGKIKTGVAVLVLLLIYVSGMWLSGFLGAKGSELAKRDSSLTQKNPNTLHSKEKRYLLFKDQANFDNWHSLVMFKLGIPSYSRSFLTDEVEPNATRNLYYVKCKRLSGGSDPRVTCTFDNQVPLELLDPDAQEKYSFTKISFRQAEEIGFLNDRLKLASEEVKELRAEIGPNQSTSNHADDVQKGFSPDTGISFDLFLSVDPLHKNRNQYVVDFGAVPNRNRISLFIDRDQAMCFRLIDDKKRSYILKLGVYETEDFLHLHCKYNENKNSMEASINGEEIGCFFLQEDVVFKRGTQRLIIGGNLNGEYNSKLMLSYIAVLEISNGRPSIIFRSDAADKSGVFGNNGRVSEIKSK